MAQSIELVRVPFHGDTLEAIKDEKGEVWVALRRLCDALGIDAEGQRRKLKTAEWAVAEEMTATGSDGKPYRMTMLNLESVPMWLARISLNKVATEVRDRLVIYQRECARVLRDHFLKGNAEQRSPLGKAEIAMLIQQITPQVVEACVRAMQGILPELIHRLIPAHSTGPSDYAGDTTTIRLRCERLGWHDSTAKEREKVRRRVERDLLLHRKPPGTLFGLELHYTTQQLSELDDAILTVRRLRQPSSPVLF